MHAIDDPAPPIAGARSLARGIPRAQILEIPQGGHLLLGHDREVQQRIRDFVAAAVR